MIEKISTGLARRGYPIKTTVPTGRNYISTTDTTVKEGDELKSKYFEADALFDQYQDLVNAEFRKWYCKMFYKIGAERVVQLASLARADGKNPRKYFSYLLRKNCPQV